MLKQVFVGCGALLALASAALADSAAVTTGNLNIRSGPGTSYFVAEVIPAGTTVSVRGCVVNSNWCRVTFAGVEGWSSAAYLANTAGGTVPNSFGVRTYASADLANFSYAGQYATPTTGTYASTNLASGAIAPPSSGMRFMRSNMNRQPTMVDTWTGRYYLQTN